MKKRALQLASVALLVGLTLPPSYGQAGGVKVKVPFKFLVADKTLPEGDYVFSSFRNQVFLQDAAGKRVAMVLTNAVDGRKVRHTGEVVFRCYTDICFLSQVWTPSEDTGREVLMSHVETEIARREVGTYFALRNEASQ